jgi:hypothetical protein
MNRLHQWLQVATVFLTEKTDPSTRRIVRTEVTVQQEQRIILSGRGTPDGFDTCPLCGQKITPKQATQLGNRLAEASSQPDGSTPGKQPS